MKRNHRVRYQHSVFRIGPVGRLFWHQCALCKEDFRYEKPSWIALVSPWVNGRGQTVFFCSSCAPDLDTAHRLAIARNNWDDPFKLPPRPEFTGLW